MFTARRSSARDLLSRWKFVFWPSITAIITFTVFCILVCQRASISADPLAGHIFLPVLKMYFYHQKLGWSQLEQSWPNDYRLPFTYMYIHVHAVRNPDSRTT
jgi:hypothetical protein